MSLQLAVVVGDVTVWDEVFLFPMLCFALVIIIAICSFLMQRHKYLNIFPFLKIRWILSVL